MDLGAYKSKLLLTSALVASSLACATSSTAAPTEDYAYDYFFVCPGDHGTASAQFVSNPVVATQIMVSGKKSAAGIVLSPFPEGSTTYRVGFGTLKFDAQGTGQLQFAVPYTDKKEIQELQFRTLL